MINFDEFIGKYNGKYVDFDGYYGPQCVDLAQKYNKECIGGRSFIGNAKDIFYGGFDPNYYTAIKNSLTGVPQKGDVMCWGSSFGGGYGHISIVASANQLTFKSFDQNFPINTPAHIQSHNDLYRGVIGWLRPKSVATSPITGSQAIELIKTKVNTNISDPDFRNWVRSLLGV